MNHSGSLVVDHGCGPVSEITSVRWSSMMIEGNRYDIAAVSPSRVGGIAFVQIQGISFPGCYGFPEQVISVCC